MVVLMHPRMIFSVVTLWALWSFHTFLISNEVILFGRNIGTLISISRRSNVLSLITFLVIVRMCLRPAITVVALSGILVIVHALLRDPNHHMEIPANNFGAHTESDDDSGYTSGESEVLVDRQSV